jgi:hypothetical protein
MAIEGVKLPPSYSGEYKWLGGKVAPTNGDSILNVYKVVKLKGSKPVYPLKAY